MQEKKIIDRKTVEHVAKLSRIRLSEEELKLYEKQLSDILEYIQKLNEVDTQTIPPTSHPLENLRNVFRNDAVKKSLSMEEALRNAANRKDNLFSVPKIIDGN